MKLRFLLLALLLALLLLVTGCANYGYPPTGILMSEVVYPAGDKAKLDATTAVKQGKASCFGILGLLAWGNCGVNEAMKQGELTKLHHVDHQTQIFFFFSKFDTLAYGE